MNRANPEGPGAEVRRAEAVINIASGGVEPGAPAAMKALASDLGVNLRVASVEPAEVAAAVRSAVAAAPDLVIVLAGDGTARLAAELCGPDGPLVAPLPGGTMNVLPNALYGGLAWREALHASLSRGMVRPVAGGEIDGRAFYVAAILGAPALWAPAREAVRHKDLARAWRQARRAFAHAFSRKLRYRLDDGPAFKTEALSVMCPMVSAACDDETAFEAAALDPQGAADAFRLGFNMLAGDWRADRSVSARRCQRARASANRPIPCILDGEMEMLGREVEIVFKPTAFRALVPAPDTASRAKDDAPPAALERTGGAGGP